LGQALSNSAYRAISEDQKLSLANANSRVSEILNSTKGDGFLKVASRLEVDGMFNINSTSVDAWKAILGHAKNRELVARYGANGIDSVNPTNGHPVTRGAIASDAEAGQPSVKGQFANATEYTGFRSLRDENEPDFDADKEDDQIDDLARKIVDQIKLRGPFLSLSEFVNRELRSSNPASDSGPPNYRALAGVVQTAINNLNTDPMAFLRDTDNSLSDKTMSDPETKVLKVAQKLTGVAYEFPKAAEGDSAYGAPGWIRQADVLRPIAPILSARDDTFTIRAYGESFDTNGEVVARAWCEAVVRRTREFCDPSDSADTIEPPLSSANITFGRKYEILSFRWLNEEEV
jgi:hypothetical protein